MSESVEVFTRIVGDIESHKLACLEMERVIAESRFAERAEKLHNCGTYVRLQEDADSGRLNVVYSNFCRQRLCPLCAWRRSLKTFLHVGTIVERLDGFEWLHVVLTVPNCAAADLPDTLTSLYSRSRALFRNPRLSAWEGVFRATEVTYSPARDDFHPHLHCLVAVRPGYFKGRIYVSQKLLQELWGGNLVWVRRVKDKLSAVAEVSKYATKPVSLRDGGVVAYEALQGALHGRRLIQTFGVIDDARKALNVEFDADDAQDRTNGAFDFTALYWDFRRGCYTWKNGG